MSSYEDLVVWQKAMQLAKRAYELTKRFPGDERFALVDQVRRAAVSVPSNIAEGQGRSTRGEFRLFLGHARGSLYELETQIRLAAELKYLNEMIEQEFRVASQEVARLLNGLIGSIK